MSKKLKILIVDDSRIFRSIIEGLLLEKDYVEIVDSVRNGVKAIESIKTNRPDLVSLDIDMPEMDGFQTLKAIQTINATTKDLPKIGVIMVSSFSKSGADETIKALQAGAFDFIVKPESKSVAESKELLRQPLFTKVNTFYAKCICSKLESPKLNIPVAQASNKIVRKAFKNIRAIAIGVSTGGPNALLNLLPELSAKVQLPIFIVQHMPPTFTQSLANSLDSKCKHNVIEGIDNHVVKSNQVYVAPGGSHMVLKRNSKGETVTVLNNDEPENCCRPSVDVLFRSVATVYGGCVVALILTGMGSDGTKGLVPIKKAGSYVIAQDEETSVVWGMPGSAVKAELVDEVLPLNAIPEAVKNVIENNS